MTIAAVPNAELMNRRMDSISELVAPLPQSTHSFKPALDFVDDELYVTLPYLREDGGTAGLVLTNQQEVFPLCLEELRQRGFTVSNVLIKPEGQERIILAPTPLGRWSQASVMRFLLGRELVDPCQLFDEIKAFFTQFVWFSDSRWYDYLTTLVMVSYVKPIFETVPIVGINGPAESGKTRLLELLEQLVFNALFASSLTPASMGRMIERDRVTLLVDEAEELSDYSRRNEVFKILRACYKKSGRRIVAAPGEGSVNEYSVYALTIVVNIAGFHPALMTRMVPIAMIPHTKMPQLIQHNEHQKIRDVRDELYCFAMQFASEIAHLYHNARPIDGIQGRDYEVWVAPLTIARLIDAYADAPGVFESLISLAHDVIHEKQQHASTTSLESVILASTYNYLMQSGQEYETNGVVASMLRDFIADQEQFKLKTEQVGAILRRYGVFHTLPRRKWLYDHSGSKVQRVCYDFDLGKLQQLVKPLFE